MSDAQKICFVVMGFGKKTDYESGRLLDLDATYEAIIQPAVEAGGYRCIRANEILHSGVIDVRMYEMLLRADLVVADHFNRKCECSLRTWRATRVASILNHCDEGETGETALRLRSHSHIYV